MDTTNCSFKEGMLKNCDPRKEEILFVASEEIFKKTSQLSLSVFDEDAKSLNNPFLKFSYKLIDRTFTTAFKLYELILRFFFPIEENKPVQFFKKRISQEIFFKGKIFRKCAFDSCSFQGLYLKGVCFESCSMTRCSFVNATLERCTFSSCTFKEVHFLAAEMSFVEFNRCSITASSFEDASIVHTCFYNSFLDRTHFFDAVVKRCAFKQSLLKNTFLFESAACFAFDKKTLESNEVFLPSCLLLVDPEKRGIAVPKVHDQLHRSAHTAALLIAHTLFSICKKRFNQEIQAVLEEIERQEEKTVPIPKLLLKKVREDPKKYVESIKVVKKAKRLAQAVDSICLPGGEDIPPAFYGEKKEEHTLFDGDFRRSFFEICLIDEAVGRGIPLMAICRGFQMANAYFGAKMVQDVKGHKGVQEIKGIDGYQGLYFQALRESFSTFVFHHQAISKDDGPKEYLELSSISEGFIKASEPKFGGAAPMILLQFHPEFYQVKKFSLLVKSLTFSGYLSKSNEVFWRILSDSANAYCLKKQVVSQMRKTS